MKEEESENAVKDGKSPCSRRQALRVDETSTPLFLVAKE
jgi:hypothetical protein